MAIAFTEPLPERHQIALREAGAADALFACKADIQSDGSYGPTWVALCPGHVAAFEGNNKALILPLADINEVKIQELYGASRLLASSANGERHLARYSRSLVGEFSLLCRLINDTKHGRPALLPFTSPSRKSCQIPCPRQDCLRPSRVMSIR